MKAETLCQELKVCRATLQSLRDDPDLPDRFRRRIDKALTGPLDRPSASTNNTRSQ